MEVTDSNPKILACCSLPINDDSVLTKYGENIKLGDFAADGVRISA